MAFRGGIARGSIITGHELAPQKLADWRFWNLHNKHVTARTLKVRQPRAAAEGVKIVGGHRCALFDEGANDLAPALVWQSGHGDFRYRRVQRQTVFDFDSRRSTAVGLRLRSGETINLTGFTDQAGKDGMLLSLQLFLAGAKSGY